MKEKKKNIRQSASRTTDPVLHHPYGVLIIPGSQALLLGSFPIAKFTNPELRSNIKPHEIDFYYGGEKNRLWATLGSVFDQKLTTKNEILEFLNQQKISLADVIQSCRSKGNSALDINLYDVTWNTALKDLLIKNKFKKIYFTSKWVYKMFLKHIEPDFKGESIVLMSPSPAASIGIAASEEYKIQKLKNPNLNVNTFRIESYRKIFLIK